MNAVLVPIPKKGDLSLCDNWRGKALLDVVGKLVARLIADRLQVVAEMTLPDSQCGFRHGRGCSDMIFSVRQIIEKVHEHHTKCFLIFIDLRKAYDSVPREALWVVLCKMGVPEATGVYHSILSSPDAGFHPHWCPHFRSDLHWQWSSSRLHHGTSPLQFVHERCN